MNRHLVGLLLGTEEDWPAAFETIMRRMGPIRLATRRPTARRRTAS